jgi:hypothetical protein
VTQSELRVLLEQENIREDAFSLDGGHPSERYVLAREPGGAWRVYYSERGQETGPMRFGTEEQAIRNLLNRLLADETTRVRRG